MSKKRIAFLGLAQAVGTVLYVMLVVFVLINLPLEDEPGHQPSQLLEFMAPVGLLLLFIASASISASLVFGYPVILALRRRVKEAALLVATTVSWIVLLTLVALATMLVVASHT